MGRTVLSFRQALNQEIASWKDFRRGLDPDDRVLFDEMMDIARHHADASSLAARPLVSESVFMSILTGMMEKIKTLEKQLEEQAGKKE
ncbi:MAG: hypothetical protein ACFFCS_04965 [Candidatus Hodarchaeota archaeon]